MKQKLQLRVDCTESAMQTRKSGVAGGLSHFLMTSARATSIQPARALAGYLRILLSTFISELELFNGIRVIPVEHRVVSEHPRNDPTSNDSGSSDAALVEGTSTDSGVTGARLAEIRVRHELTVAILTPNWTGLRALSLQVSCHAIRRIRAPFSRVPCRAGTN
jgi:hypothetical protein